jgi:hypothetical protein
MTAQWGRTGAYKMSWYVGGAADDILPPLSGRYLVGGVQSGGRWRRDLDDYARAHDRVNARATGAELARAGPVCERNAAGSVAVGDEADVILVDASRGEHSELGCVALQCLG